MKNPIYATLAALTCIYLAASNARGWSWLYVANPLRWGASTPGSHHK